MIFLLLREMGWDDDLVAGHLWRRSETPERRTKLSGCRPELDVAATKSTTTTTTMTSFAYTRRIAGPTFASSSSFQVQSEGMRVLDRDLSAKESKDVRVRVKLLLDR